MQYRLAIGFYTPFVTIVISQLKTELWLPEKLKSSSLSEFGPDTRFSGQTSFLTTLPYYICDKSSSDGLTSRSPLK